MKTKVQKWGNSLALRIPKGARRGRQTSRRALPSTCRFLRGKLIVEPSREPHYTLDDLLAEIDSDSLHEETGTGPPVGREAW